MQMTSRAQKPELPFDRGVGKCEQSHTGSFGYPTRPQQPYPFCSRCGSAMLWACPSCQSPLPDDSDELAEARFCRQCGANYFTNGETPNSK
jgi:hypothetical protein